MLREMPLTTQVAAVSAGIVDDVPPAGPVLRGGLRRHGGPQLRDDPGGGSGGAQGTGEGRAFTIQEQRQLVDLCAKGIRELLAIQAAVLEGGAL